jgi:DNA-binding winged helix-turn-helix (wHTH) protein
MSEVLDKSRRELYEFGPFRLDAVREVVMRNGQPVPLTPKAFQILLVLVRRGSDVATKDEIMKAVWPDTFVEETNLTRNIFSIRRALAETPDEQYIVTVSGKGYRLAAKVVPFPVNWMSFPPSGRPSKSRSVKKERRTGWGGLRLRLRPSPSQPSEYTFFFTGRPA